MNSPMRIELLELDIDTRLSGLWADVDEMTLWNIEAVAIFMRAAYARGYIDALTEGERGKLCREHGYKVPAER